MSETRTETIADVRREVPPRYWWLKRIAIGSVLLLVALLAFRLWWGAVAHRRLQKAIEAYEAAGEPIHPEDFDTPAVPDELNAVVLLRKAATLVTQPVGATMTVDDIMANPSFMSERTDEVRAFVEANRATLVLMRRARSRPEIDWGIQIRSPMVNFMLPSFGGYRALGKLACVTAEYQANVGDTPAAIETLRDVLFLSDAVRSLPTLIANLVAAAIDGICIRAIESLGPMLLAEAPRPSDERRDAIGDGSENWTIPDLERAIYVALVDHLLADDSLWQSLDYALSSERAWYLDSILLVSRGEVSFASVTNFVASPPTVTDRVLVWPITPLLETDALWVMRWWDQWRDYTRRIRSYNEPVKQPPEVPFQGLEALSHPMSAVLLPALDRYCYLNFRMFAMRRMAATALAIRLYELDNHHPPNTLDDLVPDYLPSLPQDPFAADGAAIGYRPNAEHPILYSVGMDGVDDDGAYELDPRGRVKRGRLDMPYFLDGQRPR